MTMDPHDLERLIDRELKSLPPPQAPVTLLPRVIAAAALRARPWYRREWTAWPVAARAAALMAAVAFIAAAFWWLPVVHAPEAAGRVVAWTARAASAIRLADAVALTLGTVIRTLVAPFVLYGIALLCLLCAMAAGVASVVKHSTVGGVSHS
jgi:hypothetical protein